MSANNNNNRLPSLQLPPSGDPLPVLKEYLKNAKATVERNRRLTGVLEQVGSLDPNTQIQLNDTDALLNRWIKAVDDAIQSGE